MNVDNIGRIYLVGTVKTRTVVTEDTLGSKDPMVFEPGDECLVKIDNGIAWLATGTSAIEYLNSLETEPGVVPPEKTWSTGYPLSTVTQRLSKLELK